jgi:formin 2
MLGLTKPISLHNRLKVWAFKATWLEEKEVVVNFYAKIMHAYQEIESNKFFLQIVGMTLSIGNILNGGTPKGQADGFDLPVLGKLVSMKDNTNQTLLQLICAKIADKHPEFPEAAKALHQSVSIKEVDTKYLKTKTQELQAMLGTARAAFAQVTGSQEPYDKFMQIFEVLLKEAAVELEVFNRNLKEVESRHKFMIEYFGIEKNDEMNDKSEEFFKVFQNFFRQIEQALPKEKPKGKALAKKIVGSLNPHLMELVAK